MPAIDSDKKGKHELPCCAGNAVERQRITASDTKRVSREKCSVRSHAGIAQLVERNLAKVEVAS